MRKRRRYIRTEIFPSNKLHESGLLHNLHRLFIHMREYQRNSLIMKKTYKIDVDCANCANKMEQAAKNTDGVKDATVNFMMLKMIVEFEEGADPKKVMKDVQKNCKVVEDDCEIFL